MSQKPVTRRVALRTLGAGTGALAVLPWLSDEGVSAFVVLQQTKAPPRLKVLSASEYATLDALAEAIIPADERSPGAREARVADYVDLLLSEGDEALRREWLEGLATLDAAAVSRFASPFARLGGAQVEALLGEISEAPPKGARRAPLQDFFARAKEGTIYGYYTSEIGIHKELRYKGNTILPEFVGCLTVDGKDCPHCGQKAEA